jgi:pyruvate dehydrogenase E1 component alpha subunit
MLGTTGKPEDERRNRRLRDLVRILDADGRERAESELSMERRVALYESMVRSRRLDERLERLQRQGRIGFHIGSQGEEAAVIGVAEALHREDWIAPCYREVAALLHRGFPLEAHLDNVFGNADDPNLGRQMPVHFASKEHRCLSVSSPIGTQLPHAVGVAYAMKARGEGAAVAAFLGDGATSSHGFHDAMTFAGVMRAGVVFFCRNNGWAISLPVSEQCAARTLSEKAAGYGIPAFRCDGNDLLAVHRVASQALDAARRGGGPAFVELVTYRAGPHSTSDDPTRYRDPDEVAAWATLDPIARMRAHLEVSGLWNEERETQLLARVDAELKAAIERSEKKPPPEKSTLFDDVYASPTPRLLEQREACLAHPRKDER